MRVGAEATKVPSPALLAQRGRFHLAYRLAARVNEVLMARGAGHQSLWVLAAAAACVALDLWLWSRLERTTGFGLAPRLAMDALDVAIWSLAFDGGYDAAVLVGVPLALEAGVRLRARGLVVPLVGAIVTGLVRSGFGRDLGLAAFKWQVITVLAGAGLAHYQARRQQVTMSRWSDEAEASRQLAHLSGQNDVAMGADSVVDLLTRTTPLLVQGDEGPLSSATLASWKASLAQSTSHGADYLGTALLVWQRQHNQTPELWRDVDLHLPSGDGTVVLTAGQAARLSQVLDGLDLHGTVNVVLLNSDLTRLPGAARSLRVDQHLVELPSDPAARSAPFDPGPLILAVAPVLWFLAASYPMFGSAPIWTVLPGSILCFGLAIAAHRDLERRGIRAHRWILGALFGITLLHTLLTTPNLRSYFDAYGAQQMPFVHALQPLAMLAGLYAATLKSVERWVLAAAVTAQLTLGCWLLPGRVHWTNLVVGLLFPLAAVVALSDVGRALRAESATLATDLRQANEGSVRQAFADGRAMVIGLVNDACQAAWQQFRQVQSSLPELIRTEAEGRLREIDQRLEDL